ncbi:MarR family winged helix-turn-helix transcriptional regulator [uncultured Dysosmobacter sp.]|uniref:MarR family winged helix-turn-helix transcriptional regulator n=1 Tax=uncultured Dysosmobacter sp. TaxID=2591384 RepID=UPI002612C0B9|nr:MarR family transcriptional regulator [uncultured Dysosmobacter sp.]
MELNECINFQLNNAQNAVFHYFKLMLAPYDVTPIQYALLKCLWTEDMQPPTQLAQTLQLDTSTVSGLLDRLEKKGLIERIYNTQDRRGIHVHLMNSGAALQGPIEETIMAANKEITAGINPEDLERFRLQLKVIENNAKAGRHV